MVEGQCQEDPLKGCDSSPLAYVLVVAYLGWLARPPVSNSGYYAIGVGRTYYLRYEGGGC